jgi:ribonuclease T
MPNRAREHCDIVGLACDRYASTMSNASSLKYAERFRGFLPVVVDVETGGFDNERDALLEIAAVIVRMDDRGMVHSEPTVSTHVVPFPGANIDPRSLEITGIDPTHPFRAAVEEREALEVIFRPIRKALREFECQRAVLVGHNASFDLGFLNAAIRRTGYKRSPFHLFSCFDTATLGGLAYGQTVLSRAVQAAGFEWNELDAHSAVYDAERTALLFCDIVNRWKAMSDVWQQQTNAVAP